jgi:predicted nucleic acid-binding protein
MAREIFVDTGAWLALADPGDTYHGVATVAARLRLNDWPSQVTTNLVVAEAYALIRYRVGYAAGMRFLELIETTPHLLNIHSSIELEQEAVQLLRRYADQPFSYTDAVSFALMRRRSIRDVFAFDRHFLIAGFNLVPAAPR